MLQLDYIMDYYISGLLEENKYINALQESQSQTHNEFKTMVELTLEEV